MTKFIKQFYLYSKISLIFVLVLAFLSGAAMALEPAVNHTNLGIAVWTLTIIFVFFIMVEKLFSWKNKPWAKFREGELGLIIRWWINISLVGVLFTMTVVVLAIH